MQLFQILFITVLTLLSLHTGFSSSVDVNNDGAATFDDTSRSVIFRNFYTDRVIHLFWEGEDGNTVKMGKLIKGGSADVNTFVGHTFFATLDPEAKQRAVPSEVSTMPCDFLILVFVFSCYNLIKLFYHSCCCVEQFVIASNQDEYIFGPGDIDPQIAVLPVATSTNTLPIAPARPLHPSVKILNTRTTAVSAKFRSLVPETIKIWYENKQGGAFQGSLGLGKEYTLNTYEGHVFFFTNEAKTVEYARYTMQKDQVGRHL